MSNSSAAAMRAAAGIVALAALLTGCVADAPAGTPTRTAGASATPTPTATPTHGAAPSSRVPATCDQLVPQAVVDRAFRVAVKPTSSTPSRTPASYSDERAGVLTCVWANGPIDHTEGLVYGWVTVVPSATRAAFDRMLAGSMFSEHEPLAVASDTDASCGPVQVQWCGFLSYSEDYSVVGGVWDYGEPTQQSQDAVIAALAGAAIPAVRALPAPEPLWQPAGPTLPGATGCDGLLTVAQVASVTGWSGVHESRSDDGENASSTLEVNHQVGSYSCLWTGDGDGLVGAEVLPGGASYATSTRPADAADVPGIGDAAFRSGDTLDVIADGAWLQVRVSGGDASQEQRLALARQELANVGYAG